EMPQRHQRAQVDRGRTHPADLVAAAYAFGAHDPDCRRRHLEQEIARAGQRRWIGFENGADLRKRRVRKTRILAGARFDRDVIANLNQFLARFRRERDPALAGSGLLQGSDAHASSLRNVLAGPTDEFYQLARRTINGLISEYDSCPK